MRTGLKNERRWTIGVMMLVMGLLSSMTACNRQPLTPKTGSETHWLQACDSTAACGEDGACICGICTVPCGANTCDGAGPEAVCLAADAPGVVALCGALPAEATGICAQGCARPEDCGEGLTCEAQACVPVVDAAEPLPQRISQRTGPVGVTQVDMLFVIDNSGSMCQEQDALTRVFDLVSGPLQGVDYRIAVTSTDAMTEQAGLFLDQPTPPVGSLNCRDAEDEPFIPNTADCDAVLANIADPALIRAGEVVDEAMLQAWFRCIATLGTGGDGFEKGLAMAVKATRCDGPNADRFSACCDGATFDPRCAQPGPAPDFLRPDAQLVVVFLTDEDDCSDAAAQPALSQFPVCRSIVDDDADGIPDGYADHCGGDVGAAACYAVDCADQDVETCAAALCAISRVDNSNCAWNRDLLPPADTIARALTGLKRDANDVTVWAYVGPILRNMAGEPIYFNRPEDPAICETPIDDIEACCPNGQCASQIAPTCESTAGASFSGHRYAALAGAVVSGCGPDDGCSICAAIPDFSGAGLRLATQRHGACLSARPGCFIDANLAPCNDAESRANPDNYALRAELDGVLKRRDADWVLTAEPACPSGLHFQALDPESVPLDASFQLLYAR